MKPGEIAILAVFFVSLFALLVLAAEAGGVDIMVRIEQFVGG